MALITSLIHLILVICTHYQGDLNKKSDRMEFKLEVKENFEVFIDDQRIAFFF